MGAHPRREGVMTDALTLPSSHCASRAVTSPSSGYITEVRVDLHGFFADEITGWPPENLVQQAWEIGVDRLRLIHGHGRNRPTAIRGANFNCGFLGLRIRNELERPSADMRRYIKSPVLDCAQPGSTCVTRPTFFNSLLGVGFPRLSPGQ
jgi:hypothetical protein